MTTSHCCARVFIRSAPEVLACQDVDEKVDMWALGVVMWVLLTGRHPFDTEVDLTEEEVAWRVVNEDPDLRVSDSQEGVRLSSPLTRLRF